MQNTKPIEEKRKDDNMRRVTLNGYVFGNCWGGGTCGYKTKEVVGDTIKEAKEKATIMLKDGSLDSGMGFESLYGAIFQAKVEDIKIIDEKEYIHTEYQILSIGKLSMHERKAIHTF
jgi:hypothetical protein